MKKILLAACLLTATLTVTSASIGQQAIVQAGKKLPPKVQDAYDTWLGVLQMALISDTYTKERNVYKIDFIGEAEYDPTGETGFITYRGSVWIDNKGTFLFFSPLVPID
ncbi:hypothetical protein [Flavisolibacter tropicus]|uniref:Uncharacterized protein n=1 Tax=Flavisolibacter tropicus TaxID=1492898 RepID=A0A172TRE5_9BACT|nr:hypothetical protein [Flavisolibacter tropicus]ANE49641.1 hypothetical protein SY85_03095 [Flavisolibacter tropicus]